MNAKKPAGEEVIKFQDLPLARKPKKEQLADMVKESCDRLQATLDAIPDILFVVDRDGRILDCNIHNKTHLYARPDQFLGRSVQNVLPEPAAGIISRAIADAVKKGHHQGSVYSLPGPGGERWYELSISAQGDMRTPEGRLVCLARDFTETRRMEESLRESEALRRAVGDNLPDGMIYQIDSGKDGRNPRYTFLSRGVVQMHGLSAADVMENPSAIYRQVLEEDRALVAEREAQALAVMKPFSAEVRVCLPSGEIRWRLFASSPRRLANGHVVWDGIEIDITERKRMEEHLRESEARRRAIINNLPGRMIYQIDSGRDGRQRCFTFLSEGVQQMHGITTEEAIMDPQRIYRQIVEEDCARLMQQEARAFRKMTLLSIEVRVRKPSGEIRWRLFNSSPRRLANGHVIWDGIEIDITDRKRTEQELQKARDELEQRVEERTGELLASQRALERNEAQFRQMAENIEEAFWLIDVKTWTVIYVSPAFERIWRRPIGKFGFDVSEWFAAMHPEDRERVVAAFRQGMKSGVPGTVTYRVPWPDGTVRWVETSGSMIRDHRGKPLHAAGVMRDVTERRHLETELLNVAEQERQRIGRDLHDGLRQSLTAIGYLAEAVGEDLARKSIPEAADVRKLRSLIGQTADEAGAIAGGLLLADMKHGSLVMALRELAARTREMFGMACSYAGLKNIPSLDEHTAIQMYRIAQEAVTNAAKHSKGKRIEIRLANKSGGLLLSVRDTGKGLSAKKKNAGIGMGIMRYRADIIGSKLWTDSSKEKGTTVSCLLPLPKKEIRK